MVSVAAHISAPRSRQEMEPLASPAWLYVFIIAQFVCVAALAVDVLGSVRFLFRLVPFVMSLSYLIILPVVGPGNPMRSWAAVGIGIMVCGLLHPDTYLLAGVAQIGLSMAVWAPVFWTGRITLTPDVFRRVFLILWILNSLSAAVGVLQVYMPGRFATDSKFIEQINGDALDGLKIRLDDGTELFRPQGLTDSPGGAALAANSAIVMGLGVALSYPGAILKLAVLLTTVMAMFCLYICQVRSLLILTVMSILGMAALMALRGEAKRAGGVVAALAGAGLVGLLWAVSLGSHVVFARFSSLFEASAGEVYYSNRGYFVEYTIETLMPQFPLGAGLGRWGMMNYYFANSSDLDNPPLWAEITLTGWVYDGGIPLVIVGYGAMIAGLFAVLRIVNGSRNPILTDLAALVAAVSLATFATTISAHVFVGQSGMMYLLLTAALLAAAANPPPNVRGAT